MIELFRGFVHSEQQQESLAGAGSAPVRRGRFHPVIYSWTLNLSVFGYCVYFSLV